MKNNNSLLLQEKEKFMVEWPGWPLLENKYGADFDREGRMRMIVGSQKLIPFLLKYQQNLRGSILEIGPFFNPLLNHQDIKEAISNEAFITFLENDPMAVKWLYQNTVGRVLDIDMNDYRFRSKLNQQIAYDTGNYPKYFNTVIISQVLNYVDHCHLLESLYPLLSPNGVLFINNEIDYGIPALFSPKRPKSNKELIQSARDTGYTIVDKKILPRHFHNEPHSRLILVLSVHSNKHYVK